MPLWNLHSISHLHIQFYTPRPLTCGLGTSVRLLMPSGENLYFEICIHLCYLNIYCFGFSTATHHTHFHSTYKISCFLGALLSSSVHIHLFMRTRHRETYTPSLTCTYSFTPMDHILSDLPVVWTAYFSSVTDANWREQMLLFWDLYLSLLS